MGKMACMSYQIRAMMGPWAEGQAMEARGMNLAPFAYESQGSPDRAGDHPAESSRMSGAFQLGMKSYFPQRREAECTSLVERSSLSRSL